MVRRVSGGYKSRHRKPERKQDPYLVIACEGETEKRYLDRVGQGHALRVRPKVFRGHHGTQLVDDAVALVEEYRRKKGDPDTEVHGAVVYDLETYSNSSIADAIQVAEYGRARGIKVWVSIPVIERWFHLHRAHIAVTRSKSVILNALKKSHLTQRLQGYKKPGDILFFNEIMPHEPAARLLCEASHIEEVMAGKIECICALGTFITEITRPSPNQ